MGLQSLSVRGLLKYTLENYPTTRAERTAHEFAGNPVAQLLRSGFPGALSGSSFGLSSSYLATGSAGQATWAEIPWLAVLDRDITASVEHGYYVVYLFTASMDGVYLSLNQGWTQYERQYRRSARERIGDVASRPFSSL